MKIAVYHNLHSGGAKRALHEILKRLSVRHLVDVYTLSTADHEYCDLRPFCQQHRIYPFQALPSLRRPLGRLNQGIRTFDLLRLRKLQKKIAADIDCEGYDVVFAHHCQFNQSPSLLQYLKTPSVYYCQEPPRQIFEPHISRPYLIYSPFQRIGNAFDPLPRIYQEELTRLDRANVAKANLVLTNSSYSRESIYRIYGVFAKVSYLGVDTSHFRPLNLEKENMLLSVGALTPFKGFDFLIKSLSMLNDDDRPALRIVCNYADPKERTYLARLADEMAVTVDFGINVSENELVELYNRTLLTIYSPIMEPFGFVPLESMACATPVVGVQEAGVRETVRDGENGLLTDRDPMQFAAALELFLADDQYRQRIGDKGRKDVEQRWRWKDAVNGIESYLGSVA